MYMALVHSQLGFWLLLLPLSVCEAAVQCDRMSFCKIAQYAVAMMARVSTSDNLYLIQTVLSPK
jgi:hypothetical protein